MPDLATVTFSGPRFFNGQRYVPVSLRPYTRKDGRPTLIACWLSHCPTCGEEFTCETPLFASKFQPNRRCQRHKRPGQRVKGGEA